MSGRLLGSGLRITLALLVLGGAARAQATCEILATGGAPTRELQDPLARLLGAAPRCPTDVFELRALIRASGLEIRTTMVANRGFHNPGSGSFSLFEMVTGISRDGSLKVDEGSFFFGHFTAPNRSGQLIADQAPASGALMIELIAFDPVKEVFNFYELIGTGATGRWHYRGDSRDIARDVRLLHRQPDPARPEFGTTLRCSGCHLNGGPIMKELAPSHNDWWEPLRKLPLGGRAPDAKLAEIFRSLVPASELASAVKAGQRRLETSPGYRAFRRTLSLQERLRPLFCPMEIGFESDLAPLNEGTRQVRVPAAFLVDPRLSTLAVTASGAEYSRALAASRAAFPEIQRADADHAWLAPVKAWSDRLAVEALLAEGLVDAELVADVLAVDFTNPALSPARCSLLRLVPEAEAPGWQAAFRANLAQAAGRPGSARATAAQLLENLTDPAKSAAAHRARARAFAEACQARLLDATGTGELFAILAQRRVEVAASEISKNPRGQILEPGFRVIFPRTTPEAVPGALALDERCEVVRNPH